MSVLPRPSRNLSAPSTSKSTTVSSTSTHAVSSFTTQEVLKLMRDGGRIVNISSVASRLTAPGRSVYAGTKAAIEAFTRVWAAELGPRGITVNSVSPGVIETERLQQQLSPELREKFTHETPLARIGQPEDIADIVLFLSQRRGPMAHRAEPHRQRWPQLTLGERSHPLLQPRSRTP